MVAKVQERVQNWLAPKVDAFNKIFLIVYAIAKDIVTFRRNVENKYLRKIVKVLAVLGTIGYLIGLYAILLPFAIMYAFVHGLLKCVYGELYGGRLLGLDVLFELKSKKTVYNIVLIFSCKDDPLVLFEKLKRSVFQLHQSHFKFGARIKSFLGYKYYVKNQVEFQDVLDVRKFNDKEYMTRDNLLDFLEENCITLTKNQMWNVVFFSQPILWNDNNKGEEKKQIALAITLRHALADFPAIMGAIKKHFNMTEHTTKPCAGVKQPPANVELNLDNVCVIRNPLTTGTDGSALKIHGKSNWHVATFIEDKVEYIPKIKAIKQELNCTFIELMVSVLSASICDYVAKRKVKLKNFTVESVTRPTSEDISSIINASYNYDELENHFGGLLFNVPYKTNDRNIKNRITEIHNNNERLPYAIDPFLAYTLLQYVGTYFPSIFLQITSKIFVDNMTLGISNVVGLSECTCGENNVDDIIFFTPDFLTLGFLFFVHSYAGRIQVSGVSRRGFVHNRDELQEILNNAFRYIDQAEIEIQSTHIP